MTGLRLDHIEHADALTYLRTLPDESVNLAVTSPPYFGLRAYLPPDHPDKAREIGAEPTPAEFVAALVAVFAEVKRVLRADANLYVNLGDSYASAWPAPSNRRNIVGNGSIPNGKREARPPRMPDGLREKELMGIPWRFAFAMQDAGWILREDIIWHKPAPMPESVRDRCTRAHEYIFHFVKQPRYWYDQQAVMEDAIHAGKVVTLGEKSFSRGQATGAGVEPSGNGLADEYLVPSGRNRRSVWTVNTAQFTGWTENVRRHPVSVHELSGGTKRITSPDCPIHGSTGQPGSIHVCDEREADSLRRIADTYARHAQAQSAGSVPTDQNHVSGLPEQSSNCSPAECVPSATAHSSEGRKTDHAPATTPPYRTSGETASHTGDTSVLPASVAPHHDTPVNSTSQGEPDARLPGQTSGDTADTLSSVSLPCTCQFYRETTEKTSHFATFPEKLVEPMILAGCPEGGVVLDPFAGAGTTCVVAKRLNRRYVGCDLNPEYVQMARARIDSIPYTLFSLMGVGE